MYEFNDNHLVLGFIAFIRHHNGTNAHAVIAENPSGRYVWYALIRCDTHHTMITGSAKYNRWDGRGDDDEKRAMQDAEETLLSLGYTQRAWQ